MPQKSLKTLRKTNERRQIQCRLNQRKYRAQSKQLSENLEYEVAHLNRETAKLEGRLETLRSTMDVVPRHPFHHGGLRMCRHYWDLFSRGYSFQNPRLAEEQMSMLRSVMCEDLEIMDSIGVEKLIEQWKLYGKVFHSFHKIYRSWEIAGTDPSILVRGSGIIYLRISRETIVQLYPYVLSNEFLMQKLIGKEVCCPLALDFFLDSDGCRVKRFDVHLDFTTGMVILLGNLNDAATIMSHAHIKASAEIYPALSR
jgi:hypothetical protein